VFICVPFQGVGKEFLNSGDTYRNIFGFETDLLWAVTILINPPKSQFGSNQLLMSSWQTWILS